MEIIALELSHFNLFCPVTGQRISGPATYQASPAQVGLWLGGLIEQPEISCAELQAAWERYADGRGEDLGIDLDAFLLSIALPNYVCFAVTLPEISCDRESSTVWYVFNMDYVAPADAADAGAALL